MRFISDAEGGFSHCFVTVLFIIINYRKMMTSVERDVVAFSRMTS
jgi:hypothetical protein